MKRGAIMKRGSAGKDNVPQKTGERRSENTPMGLRV